MSVSIGHIGWIDLTVPDAKEISEFYRQVVGWKSAPVAMDNYDDFNMLPPEGSRPVAGICHARGLNADLPAQWLIYIVVADLDRSLQVCAESGGRVLAGPITAGGESRYAIVADPAGAVAALYEPQQEN